MTTCTSTAHRRKHNVEAARLTVGLDFFSTMRIPLLAGRTFNSADFAAASAIIAARTAAEEAASKATASDAGNRAIAGGIQAEPSAASRHHQ